MMKTYSFITRNGVVKTVRTLLVLVVLLGFGLASCESEGVEPDQKKIDKTHADPKPPKEPDGGGGGG